MPSNLFNTHTNLPHSLKSNPTQTHPSAKNPAEAQLHRAGGGQMRLTTHSVGSHQLTLHFWVRASAKLQSYLHSAKYKSSKTCIKRSTGYKSCCRRVLFKKCWSGDRPFTTKICSGERNKLTDMKKAPHFTKSSFQMLDPYYTSSPLHNGRQKLGSLKAGPAIAEHAQVTAKICLGSSPMQFETHLFKICYSLKKSVEKIFF